MLKDEQRNTEGNKGMLIFQADKGSVKDNDPKVYTNTESRTCTK